MINLLLTLPDADHMPIFPNRVFNVISCIIVWMLALFANYWRTHPVNTFTMAGWWKDDRTRFIAGTIVTLALVILKATSQVVDDMLKMLGFQVTNSSGVAYGLAIAAFLLGLKTIQKTNETTNKEEKKS